VLPSINLLSFMGRIEYPYDEPFTQNKLHVRFFISSIIFQDILLKRAAFSTMLAGFQATTWRTLRIFVPLREVFQKKSIFEFSLAKRAKNRKARKGNIGLSSHNFAYFAYLRSFAGGLLKEINFRILSRQARKESQSPLREYRAFKSQLGVSSFLCSINVPLVMCHYLSKN